MKISLHSVSYAGFFYQGEPLTLKDVIARLSKYGYDGVELMAKRPHGDPMDLNKKARKDLAELAESFGVGLAGLAAYNDFSGPDSFKRELNLLYTHDVIELARDLDVRTVRVFAAGMRDIDESLPYHKQWELCREGLSEAAKWAKEFGVTVALQNHPPIMESYRDTIEMIEEVGHDSLKACIDPELLLTCRDIDPISEDLGKDLSRIYSECKDLLVFVHVGDYTARQGKVVWIPRGGGSRLTAERLERATLGKGVFGKIAGQFIKTLGQINYNGFVSYEICSPRYIKHTLIDLQTVEREAVEGLKYLRDLTSKV